MRCPACGAKGRPAEPDVAFEAHGRVAGRSVRQCSSCGAGLVVSPLGRARLIPAETWEQMKAHARELGELRRLTQQVEALEAELGPERESREQVEAELARVRVAVEAARARAEQLRAQQASRPRWVSRRGWQRG